MFEILREHISKNINMKHKLNLQGIAYTFEWGFIFLGYRLELNTKFIWYLVGDLNKSEVDSTYRPRSC